MTDSTPSRGKIGCLSHPLREKVNHRLLDGQVDTEILPWLNDLPEVKARLADRFGGEPISPQNLSAWRLGPYQRWIAERKEIEGTKALAEFAASLVDAAGVRMSSGAKALAAGRVMERLGKMGEETDLDSLLSTIKAVKDLHAGDVADARLDLDRVKTDQAARTLELAEDKFRYATADKILAALDDARAKEIAASDASREVKMDQLILHIWGKRPESTPAP